MAPRVDERRYRPLRLVGVVSASVAATTYVSLYLATVIRQDRVLLDGAGNGFDAFLYLSIFATVLVMPIVIVAALVNGIVLALCRATGVGPARTSVAVAAAATTAAAVVALHSFLYGSSLLLPESVLLPMSAALGVLVAVKVDVIAEIRLIPVLTAGLLAVTAFTSLAATTNTYVLLEYVIAVLGSFLFTVALAFVALVATSLVARTLRPMTQSLIGAVIVGASWIAQLVFLGDGVSLSAAIVGIAAGIGYLIGAIIPARSKA